MIEYHRMPIEPLPQVGDVFIFTTVQEPVVPSLAKYHGDGVWTSYRIGKNITYDETPEQITGVGTWGDSVRWGKINFPTE